jgi:hypothetical protein
VFRRGVVGVASERASGVDQEALDLVELLNSRDVT